MGRKLLHLLNGLITCTVVVALVIAGAYAGYSLWDNQQVYSAAETVNAELKEIRSTMGMPTMSAMEQMLEENRKAREARAAELAAAEAAAAQATETPTAAPVETAIPSVTEETTTPDITEKTVSAATTTETTAAETIPSGVSVSDETPAPTDIPSTEEKTSATEETPDPVKTTAPAETNMQAMPATVPGTPVVTETAINTDTPTSLPTATLTAVPTEAPTPEPTEEPDNSPFGQLKAINPDITAWITMPGTAIDYPILQGSTNYSYINKDVYGNFALAGSIFLDSRNNGDYTDIYSLLYGHNMDQHRMFGDVNLYKEKDFFDQNTLGMLLMPDGAHILESLSVIVVPASDSGLFNPENWTYLDGEGIYSQVQENAMFTCEKGLEALREQIDAGMTPRLVALSTCSDEFTDARTILLTLMDP